MPVTNIRLLFQQSLNGIAKKGVAECFWLFAVSAAYFQQ
jgi:hypothetical protein